MSLDIRRMVEERGISRLCHFTQARNMPHILEAGALLPTAQLEAAGVPFNRNDPTRADHHEGYVCCTVEYPNAWFMAQASARESLFQDWIVLTIEPGFLWEPTTRFAPVNAATGGGRYISDGPSAFEAMFDVSPPAGRHPRSMLHLESCPTESQAEVLIANPIPTDAIISLVFCTNQAAAAEWARFLQLEVSDIAMPFFVCEAFFRPHDLANLIGAGERPREKRWIPAVPSSAGDSE